MKPPSLRPLRCGLLRRAAAALCLACLEALALPLLAWSAEASIASGGAPAASIEQRVALGRTAFQSGWFEEAIRLWGEVLDLAANDEAIVLEALQRRAEAYQALGHFPAALRDMTRALALAEARGAPAELAGVAASLGNLKLRSGAWEEAQRDLEHALAKAREAGDPSILAVVQNNLGNLWAERGQWQQAQRAYLESALLAEQSGRSLLAAKALTNAAHAFERSGDRDQAAALLERAVQRLHGAAGSRDKVHALIAAGNLLLRLGTAAPGQARAGEEALMSAARTATELRDDRTLSHALGALGRMHEDEKRYDEALALTRRAIFAAQHAQAHELLYLWQWQAGRLLRSTADLDGALAAYRQAVFHLQSIRHDLAAALPGAHAGFRETQGRVSFELADLLLARAARLTDKEAATPYLLEARQTIELLKAAELRDYFQDDCVTELQSRITPIDRLPAGSAAIYPILLAERTELLLSLPSGIRQVTVPVGRDALTGEVRALRRGLEKRTTREFLPQAKQLYEWLVRPLEPELQGQSIDTLVIIPDGALRTIPMAALHDGERFLIERYALATTPGLTLTDARPLGRSRPQVLLGGVSRPVQGFPSLGNVPAELREIRALYGGRLMQDEGFLLPSLSRELERTPYTIVHIASHGQFDSDPRKTFLLTFDDRLDMNRLGQLMGLSQYRTEPVELLTLSACQTAAGDDRAALGLAGLAIKAGARSALAGLWFINDEATSVLIAEFYRHLREGGVSKAQALQRAQIKLLADRRYAHPGYWAPFLLIGSWL